MHLPYLTTSSPDSTYTIPSFIERFNLPMVITKTKLMLNGVIHYSHSTTALLVHPPPLLTDNTIAAEKDFYDAIMSLEHAQIEGALCQIGKPGLIADIHRYHALTLDIEEEHCLIALHEQR
ncbi:hypothetical protein EW146_g7224 [Bondarzewia mesenterica]|uniref:Uncharacterized protein n=1 Tax=Bondarzewia mesenterica TaxID=1095465 RepID=A0A4S4LLY8_9AGAM|nr:hypothetical protein EW146_g7224 [Bondarzewia mesenterica]